MIMSMFKYCATVFLLFFLPLTGHAQSNYWNELSDVTFSSKKIDEYEIDIPIFGKRVLLLHEKKISLKGYLIPLAESGDRIMLSSFPFSSCFFCGSAGPETVVELLPKKKMNFSDDAVLIEGVLILNKIDFDRHIYLLKDAFIIK